MQLIISIVTPLDFSRQVEYSCVISLSAAATNGVLKKNAKPIAVTFLVHSRLFATSLLNFSIIVNSHLRTHHRCLAIEIVHPVPLCCQLRDEEIDTRPQQAVGIGNRANGSHHAPTSLQEEPRAPGAPFAP